MESNKIKFRAFWKKGNRMLSSNHLRNATMGMVDCVNNEIKKRCLEYNKPASYGLFLPLWDEELIFMQYVGMNDRNDVEIYEDDIILHTLANQKYQVVWKDGIGFRLKRISQMPCEDFYLSADFCQTYAEVIGNAYQNPELLEV